MVECTLSITHCLRLNLQLHTIDSVRTCRVSSFCTVAWQLARFQLTRRIARSLGDSGASCVRGHASPWKTIRGKEIQCRSYHIITTTYRFTLVLSSGNSGPRNSTLATFRLITFTIPPTTVHAAIILQIQHGNADVVWTAQSHYRAKPSGKSRQPRPYCLCLRRSFIVHAWRV